MRLNLLVFLTFRQCGRGDVDSDICCGREPVAEGYARIASRTRDSDQAMQSASDRHLRIISLIVVSSHSQEDA